METQPVRPKRGLSALLAATTLPPVQTAGPTAQPAAIVENPVSTADVSVKAIRPNPSQPRTHFNEEALNELAASIKARGLIQPVVVRQLRTEEVKGEHKFEIIAGERRWRAAQRAGLDVIPIVVKKVFEDRDILLLSLVENLQRDDLNPIEEALAYERLASTFNLTHEQIADGVGKSRVSVTNMIRLLSLPTTVVEAIKIKSLSVGHAKVLLGIPDPKIQAQLAVKVQAENMTVKDLERLLIAPTPPGTVPIHTSHGKSRRGSHVAPSHLQEAERRLREHFGTKVIVQEGPRKGSITIEFYSVEDFQRITNLMGLD